MGNLFSTLGSFLISGVAFALLIAVLFSVHKRLLSTYANQPNKQYQRQLIMLGASLIGLIFVIVIIPVGDAMQGQLLSLLGIVLSATIALSATTIVGNAMAGLMLKTLRKIKPGTYISVNDHYGRVSEMDLLHTEIQTEDRDLTTLPNLYLVTHPVRVLRSSGTILSVEVSLGYEISRHLVEETLLKAADKTGLASPFVQIRELGDFSVTYRIGGVAEDLETLITTRRKLRANTLDELHAAGIEIVSPSFMNTRQLRAEEQVVPPRVDEAGADDSTAESVDEVVFDKANQAEGLEELREQRAELDEWLAERESTLKAIKDKDSPECRIAEQERDRIAEDLAALDEQIATAEARIAED